MRSVKPLILGLGLVFCTGCPPTKPSASGRVDAPVTADTSGTVALINGEEISLTEFERRIQALPPYTRARYATTEAKLEFLEAQAEFEILADRAEKKGFGTSPEVNQAVKEVLVKQWLNEQLRVRVSMQDITEDEIRKAYEADPTRYQSPAMRRVAILGSDRQSTAQKLREIVEGQTYDEPVKKLNMLRRLADVHHIDPALKKKGGDFGFVEDPTSTQSKNTGLQAEVARYVFGEGMAQIGDLTPVFEFNGAFYFASFIEERPALARELRDVEDEIREQLYQARRSEERVKIFEELRKTTNIQIFDDVLASVGTPTPRDETLERLLRGANKVRVPEAQP